MEKLVDTVKLASTEKCWDFGVLLGSLFGQGTEDPLVDHRNLLIACCLES